MASTNVHTSKSKELKNMTWSEYKAKITCAQESPSVGCRGARFSKEPSSSVPSFFLKPSPATSEVECCEHSNCSPITSDCEASECHECSNCSAITFDCKELEPHCVKIEYSQCDKCQKKRSKMKLKVADCYLEFHNDCFKKNEGTDVPMKEPENGQKVQKSAENSKIKQKNKKKKQKKQKGGECGRTNHFINNCYDFQPKNEFHIDCFKKNEGTDVPMKEPENGQKVQKSAENSKIKQKNKKKKQKKQKGGECGRTNHFINNCYDFQPKNVTHKSISHSGLPPEDCTVQINPQNVYTNSCKTHNSIPHCGKTHANPTNVDNCIDQDGGCNNHPCVQNLHLPNGFNPFQNQVQINPQNVYTNSCKTHNSIPHCGKTHANPTNVDNCIDQDGGCNNHPCVQNLHLPNGFNPFQNQMPATDSNDASTKNCGSYNNFNNSDSGVFSQPEKQSKDFSENQDVESSKDISVFSPQVPSKNNNSNRTDCFPSSCSRDSDQNLKKDASLERYDNVSDDEGEYLDETFDAGSVDSSDDCDKDLYEWTKSDKTEEMLNNKKEVSYISSSKINPFKVYDDYESSDGQASSASEGTSDQLNHFICSAVLKSSGIILSHYQPGDLLQALDD